MRAGGFEPEDDQSEAALLADQCVAAAKKKNITKAEIEEETANLVDYMNQSIDDANDTEIERRKTKDHF